MEKLWMDRIKELETKVDRMEVDFYTEKEVPFKKLHPNAIIPTYQHEDDACFDFYALIDNTIGYIVVEPNDQIVVPTGIACSIPKNYEIQVRPRSGLAGKFKITVTNSPGTVDSSYVIPNEIRVIIFNLSNQPFSIKNGDRIGQGKLSRVFKAKFVEVEYASEEDRKRDRGGGFGSTGR
jgi:dUTP pyrophosphatase